MNAADSNARISPADRDLMRRLTAAILFVVLLTAASSYLWRLYATKFYDITGSATWIWPQHRLSRNVPLAFFAAHDFDLPPHRAWTRIKILGDPEYTLYFNGQLIGGRRVRDDRQLDVFDVSEIARDKGNRILVAVRSTNGVGGLIASIDLKPDIENYVVTSEQWKVFRSWDDALPLRDAGRPESPVSLGQPPAGRWNFLTTRKGDRVEPVTRVLQPHSAEGYVAALPTVAIVSGVAVAGDTRVRATAFDFGPTTGRVRLTIDRNVNVATVIEARTANAPEELRMIEPASMPFVFAPGERTVTDPVERQFRYVIVYGGRAHAEVLQ